MRCVGLTLIVLCWSLGVCAQTAALAPRCEGLESCLRAGTRALERGDYKGALVALERESTLSADPRIDFLLARAHAELGELIEAADAYRRVVANIESDELRPALRRLASRARDELALLRPRIPAIELAIDDSTRRLRGLRIELDGQAVRGDAPLPVNPGGHELVVSALDEEQARSSFQIGEGESKLVSLDWSAGARGRGLVPRGAGRTRRAWGVVALSVGSTGLGMGTVTGTLSCTRVFAGDRHCPAGRCSLGTPAPDDGSAIRDLRTITPSGYVLGAAGIGTWLGLLVSTPTVSATSDHPRVSSWTPIVGLGSAGARYVF